MFTKKNYVYQDWNDLFSPLKANSGLSFLDKIIIARNSLRYGKILNDKDIFGSKKKEVK